MNGQFGFHGNGLGKGGVTGFWVQTQMMPHPATKARHNNAPTAIGVTTVSPDGSLISAGDPPP